MKTTFAFCLNILLMFCFMSCSEQEEWVKFSVEGGGVCMLPQEVRTLRIEGGVPPFSVSVEHSENISASVVEPTDAYPFWALQIETSGETDGIVRVADSEGRISDVSVAIDWIRLSYLLKGSELFMSPHLRALGMEKEIQEMTAGSSFPFKEMIMDFESFYNGCLNHKSFRDVPFQMDDKREHVTFSLSPEEQVNYRIEAVTLASDDPEHYKLLPSCALPPVYLLLEDFTDECRQRFPGLLGEDDYVRKGYYLEIQW